MFGLGYASWDYGMRETGGLATVRPSWEDTPINYPISSLNWTKLLMESRVEGGGKVINWTNVGSVGNGFNQHVTAAQPSIGAVLNTRKTISFDGTNDVLELIPPVTTDPLTLAWQLFFWDDYSGSPWVGTATAGNSGTRNLTEATNPPATGASQNGFIPPDFQAAFTPDLLSAPGVIIDDLGNGTTTTGWTLFAVFTVDSLVADTNYYDEALIVGSSGGNLSLCVSASGVRLVSNDSAGTAVTTGRVAVTPGTHYVAVGQWTGTQLTLRVDDVTSATPGALTSFWPADFNGNSLIYGRNYDGLVSLDGRIHATGTINSVLTAGQITDLTNVLEARFQLVADNTFLQDLSGFQIYCLAKTNRFQTDGGIFFMKDPVFSVNDTTMAFGFRDAGAGANKISFFNMDGSSVEQPLEFSAASATWYLSTIWRERDGITRFRLNQAVSSQIATASHTDPPSTNLYTYLGFNFGSALYGQVDMAALAVANGQWTYARQRDVERYFNAYYFTAGGTTYTQTVDDTLAVSDTVVRNAEFGRLQTEALVVSETLTREAVFGKAVSDTVTTSDTLGVGRVLGVGISDTAAVSDTTTRNAEFGRVLGDTVVLAETLTREAVFGSNVSDTVSVGDTIGAGRDVSIVVNDTAAVADTVTRNVEFGRSLSDSLVLAEQLTVAITFGRTLSETIAVTDSATVGRDIATVLADTLAVTDSIVRGLEAGRVLAETLVLSDAFSPAAEYLRTFGDTVAMTDVLTGGLDQLRALVDTLAVTDSFTISRELGRIVADAMVLTESLAREATFARLNSDTVVVADDTVGGLDGGYLVTISDTIAVSDTTSVAFEFLRSIADALVLTEQLAREAQFGRTNTDSIVITDSSAVGRDIATSLSDTLAVSDSTLVGSVYGRVIVDSLALLDDAQASVAGLVLVTVNDTIAIVDVFSPEASYTRSVGDTLSVADSSAVGRDIATSLGDTIALTDQLVASSVYHRLFAENLALTDLVTVGLDVLRSLSDAIAITDSVTAARTATYVVVLTDSFVVTDNLATAVAYQRFIDDGIVLLDLAERVILVPFSTNKQLRPRGVAILSRSQRRPGK